MSLLSDLQKLAAADNRVQGPPVEHQKAMSFFCDTSLCFELQATNRFKDPRLAELMNFMRKPTKDRVPAPIAETWNRIQMKPNDPRLREERFQMGHMIAWYWGAVARWMMMRARMGRQVSRAGALPRTGRRFVFTRAAHGHGREAGEPA